MNYSLYNFYLYRHIRKDLNEVFYVGIGKRTAQDLKYNTYQRAYVKGNRNNKDWWDIVNNTEYEVEIILESDSESWIKNKEKEFIALYKRKVHGGTLVNRTAGGQGVYGHIHSPEARAKMRQKRALQAPISKEGRERIAATHRNNKWAVGYKHTPEARARISAALRNRVRTPEFREKHRLRMTGSSPSKETRRKISETLTKKIGRRVAQYNLEGELIAIHPSLASLLGKFDRSLVSQCCQGKRRLHKGFSWKYINN